MNSSFRNLQVCLYPAHSNALSCGKVAFYADFMRFPVRYPSGNRHKIGVRPPKNAEIARFEGKKGPGDVPLETPLAASPARRAQCRVRLPTTRQAASLQQRLYLPSGHLLEKSRVPAGLRRRPFVTLKTIFELFEKSKSIRGGYFYFSQTVRKW